MINKLKIIWFESNYFFSKIYYRYIGLNLKQINKKLKNINKNLVAIEKKDRMEILYKKITILYCDKSKEYILDKNIIKLIKKEL
jgi:Iap family predicted aminopeptidase